MKNEINEFFSENCDILLKTRGFGQHNLMNELRNIKKPKRGYYKNSQGLYIFIKSVELKDDGLFINYCVVDDNHIRILSESAKNFNGLYFSDICNPNRRMAPTTKDDFETKVKEVTESVCSEGEESIDVEKYITTLDKWQHLCDDYISHSC